MQVFACRVERVATDGVRKNPSYDGKLKRGDCRPNRAQSANSQVSARNSSSVGVLTRIHTLGRDPADDSEKSNLISKRERPDRPTRPSPVDGRKRRKAAVFRCAQILRNCLSSFQDTAKRSRSRQTGILPQGVPNTCGMSAPLEGSAPP